MLILTAALFVIVIDGNNPGVLQSGDWLVKEELHTKWSTLAFRSVRVLHVLCEGLQDRSEKGKKCFFFVKFR